MTNEEIIRDIKKELRANMNGVASKYMRENGAQYHVNWGIELPRLRAIANEFEPSHEVAQQLWHENVRESKILATMLMPIERFYEELADIWVQQIENAEIAQMASMNLFSRLPYAASKAFEWIATDEEMKQLCGYLVMARLLMNGAELNEWSADELKDQMDAAFPIASLPIKKAIMAVQSHLIPTDEMAKDSSEEK